MRGEKQKKKTQRACVLGETRAPEFFLAMMWANFCSPPTGITGASSIEGVRVPSETSGGGAEFPLRDFRAAGSSGLEMGGCNEGCESMVISPRPCSPSS